MATKKITAKPKKVVAKKATVKKATAKKTIAKKTRAAKNTTAKKMVKPAGRKKKEATPGDKYSCSVCGLIVSVDEESGFIETCDIICCGEQMETKK